MNEAGARLNSFLSDMGVDLEGFHRLRETDADALNSAIDAFAKEDAYCHSRVADLGAELEELDRSDIGSAEEAVRAAGEARAAVVEKLAETTERLRYNRGV